MLEQELIELIKTISEKKCEGQHLEIKKAAKGTPEHLYDTLSSFSNQRGGGIIVFGIDEKNDFAISGIYNPQDLIKRVTEQCEQMEPPVRPLFTICKISKKVLVSAEISECDIYQKPCFYKGKGKFHGSYIRVGESDKPMSDYEIYSYEVFRRKIQDELRVDDRAKLDDLNPDRLNEYFSKIKKNKKNLSAIDNNKILALQGITQNNRPTIVGELLFGIYPQSLFPQYGIIASVVSVLKKGDLGNEGERFVNDKRFEGTIGQMLDEAVSFVARNMKHKIIMNEYGKRIDKYEYPIKAVREAILNALVHRDYSIHTENCPIRILMFDDRIEIENPGGLFGRGSLDNLGNIGLDTRNPYLANALELLDVSENRYSGIPIMRREMESYSLQQPLFESNSGFFRVTFYNSPIEDETKGVDDNQILKYCLEPRTREELAKRFGFESQSYFMKLFIQPLVEKGKIGLTLPNTPKSKKQKYYTISF